MAHVIYKWMLSCDCKNSAQARECEQGHSRLLVYHTIRGKKGAKKSSSANTGTLADTMICLLEVIFECIKGSACQCTIHVICSFDMSSWVVTTTVSNQQSEPTVEVGFSFMPGERYSNGLIDAVQLLRQSRARTAVPRTGSNTDSTIWPTPWDTLCL